MRFWLVGLLFSTLVVLGGAVSIDACGTYGSGAHVLSKDLNNVNNCLVFSAGDSSLDCQGHFILGAGQFLIKFQGAANNSLFNCNVTQEPTYSTTFPLVTTAGQLRAENSRFFVMRGYALYAPSGTSLLESYNNVFSQAYGIFVHNPSATLSRVLSKNNSFFNTRPIDIQRVELDSDGDSFGMSGIIDVETNGAPHSIVRIRNATFGRDAAMWEMGFVNTASVRISDSRWNFIEGYGVNFDHVPDAVIENSYFKNFSWGTRAVAVARGNDAFIRNSTFQEMSAPYAPKYGFQVFGTLEAVTHVEYPVDIRVVDYATGAPVAGAQVNVTNLSYSVPFQILQTDSDGWVRNVYVPLLVNGTHGGSWYFKLLSPQRVSASKDGLYYFQDVYVNQSLSIVLPLGAPLPTPIPTPTQAPTPTPSLQNTPTPNPGSNSTPTPVPAGGGSGSGGSGGSGSGGSGSPTPTSTPRPRSTPRPSDIPAVEQTGEGTQVTVNEYIPVGNLEDDQVQLQERIRLLKLQGEDVSDSEADLARVRILIAQQREKEAQTLFGKVNGSIDVLTKKVTSLKGAGLAIVAFVALLLIVGISVFFSSGYSPFPHHLPGRPDAEHAPPQKEQAPLETVSFQSVPVDALQPAISLKALREKIKREQG